MSDLGKKINLNKKAYEIAYALFRLSKKSKELALGDVLEREAIGLLAGVIGGSYEKSVTSLEVLEYMIKLAGDINVITFDVVEIFTKEIDFLKSNIATLKEIQKNSLEQGDIFSESRSKEDPISLEEVGLQAKKNGEGDKKFSSGDFFSKEGIAVSRAEEFSEARKEDEVSGLIDKKYESDLLLNDRNSAKQDQENNTGGNFLKSGMRQIAILDKIRKSGSCRMRDILEILPDSSERTIRYDLEALMERKIIERTGNGGPSVSYRMRQM